MTRLTVTNGYQAAMPEVGKVRGLRNVSEKRVTKAVREKLQRWYGDEAIEVACGATRSPDGWQGHCKIHGEDFEYKLSF